MAQSRAACRHNGQDVRRSRVSSGTAYRKVDKPMSPEELLERAGEQMRALGWDVALVDPSHARGYVGYLSKFRLRWVASKLHLFVFVVAAPDLTLDALTSITDWSVEHARRQKGVTRQQVGVAVALVLVTSTPDPRVRSAVEAGSGPSVRYMVDHSFGGDILIERAIVDADTGVVYGDVKRRFWGRIFRPWVRSQMKAVLPLPDAAWPGGSTNGFAVASVVLGALWIFWIGSILALVFGYRARKQIGQSGGTQRGRGMATAGIVLGYIWLAWFLWLFFTA